MVSETKELEVTRHRLPGFGRFGFKARFLTIGSAAIVTVLSAAYLFPVIQLLHRVGDEGTVVYGAQRVLEGQVPYRNFLELMGPGSFCWLALFFKLFGLNWQITRFYLLFNGTVSSLLVYSIARRCIRGPASLLPCLCALILGLPFWPGCSHHWDSNLFALAAIFCFLKWQDAQRVVWLIASGTLAGITSCVLQQKGLFLVLAFVVALHVMPLGGIRGKSAWRATRLLLAAYAGVGAFVIVWFYRASALRDLVYGTFLWPLFSYGTVNTIPYAKGMADLPFASCSLLFAVLPFPFALLVAFLCLLPFIAIVVSPLFLLAVLAAAAWKPGVRGIVLRGPTLTIVLTALALWLSEIHRSDMIHLLFGAPILLIALFVLAERLFGYQPIKTAVVAAITLGVVLLGCLKLAECRTSYKIETRRGTVLGATQDDALAFLNSSVARREWVFVYPYYPMYYYLADVRNPTRFSILMYHYNTAGDFEEIIHDLESKHVKYVLWDTVVDGANLRKWFPAYVQPPEDQLKLEQYLHLAYDVVSMKNGFRILRRNRY